MIPPDLVQLRFKVSRLIFSDRVEIVSSDQMQAPTAATMTFESSSRSGTLTIGALPRSTQPRRVPYDETAVTAHARFARGSVAFDGTWPFGFAGTVVSLHKALLQSEIKPRSPGRWLFARLDLSRIPSSPEPLRIVRDRDLGAKLVKSRIEASGVTIGELYFSWLEQST